MVTRLGEKGSMTLLGTWLVGFMLLMSATIFVYSNQELRISNLERESYHRQLLAESLLERQLILFRQDFSQIESILSKNSYKLVQLSEGVQGDYIYNINALHDDAGKVLVAVVVKNQDNPQYENIFSLRWHLEVDTNEKTVERCGIG